MCREQTTFGITTTVLCWGIPVLALSNILKSLQGKSNDRMPKQYTKPMLKAGRLQVTYIDFAQDSLGDLLDKAR